VPNGVDVDYFLPRGLECEPDTMVFNGTLHYRPNLDAAYYLVDEIWPLVEQRCPHARLTIVGRGAEADLRRLRRPNVVVTGEVPDVRPYLERAAVVGVPVRMGGGTRLKVVEALAMGKAMVSTTLGCEGVKALHRKHLWIADDAESFASGVAMLFADAAQATALGLAGRALMEEAYSWDMAGTLLEGLYRRIVTEGVVPGTTETLLSAEADDGTAAVETSPPHVGGDLRDGLKPEQIG
jgi:glycosyltransferase involved in cell wall biosynthesis